MGVGGGDIFAVKSCVNNGNGDVIDDTVLGKGALLSTTFSSVFSGRTPAGTSERLLKKHNLLLLQAENFR